MTSKSKTQKTMEQRRTKGRSRQAAEEQRQRELEALRYNKHIQTHTRNK